MADPLETLETDVLIVGAGAAGLRTAIELAGQSVDCLVVGKRAHGDAHTRWAAGGINASLGTRDPADDWTLHAADTIREGHFLCDPGAVELLCRHAPARVRELRSWGCAFNQTADGRIDQRYFGAQSYRRTCFAGDRTGEAILETLVARARELRVAWREGLFITRILKTGGRAAGALGFDTGSGRPILVRAAAVVLAAGGCTSVYHRSSSRPDENTGDAMALALHAGAALRDMEFVQFHPTGMVDPPEMRGRLVTEAVRGEGGRLFNAAGERFMERYAPDRMELDARDVVARAIFQEIQAGRGTPARAVLLDISHRDAAFIEERLPKIARQLREHGVDITREPVEVAPTAHYAMGGIKVDFQTGRTTVPGLFAVGEATAGVHGANRLGGNSLAETVVFGAITGAHVCEFTADHRPARVDPQVVEEHRSELEAFGRARGPHRLDQLVEALGQMLWSHAGIVRTREGLRDGIRELTRLRTEARTVGIEGPAGASYESAFNLQFMLLTGEALLRSALLREESRGAHFLADVPREDSKWTRNIVCALDGSGALRLWTEPVPAIPDEIQAGLGERRQLHYHLLE